MANRKPIQRQFATSFLTGIVFLWFLAHLSACEAIKEMSSLSADTKPKLQRISYISEIDNKQRDYFVYLPANYQADPQADWPVLLFLHGNGERGNGLDELDFVLKHGPLYEAWIQKRDLPFIIISPQLHMFNLDQQYDYLKNRDINSIPTRLADGVPERQSYFTAQGPMSGSPEADMSAVPLTLPYGWNYAEADLLAILRHVNSHFRTDQKRIYLTGLSYGGFGTWWMASHHPELFAAIAPVVGWGHPDLMPPVAQHKIPTWVFAGGRDNVIEVKNFYAGVNRLEELGHHIRFTTHEDMPHDTWRRVYASHDLYHWLLQFSLP